MKVKKVTIEATPLLTVLKDSIVLEMKIITDTDTYRTRITKPTSFFLSYFDVVIDALKKKMLEVMESEVE